jgi:drug/metabolite transporter (DMT)-like permease
LKAFPSVPALALIAGASLWGVVWYPYRLLAQAGIDGIWSSLFTYGAALVIGGVVFFRHWRSLWPPSVAWIVMALAIGWSNLAYVIGVLEGEVMRVLFLFYLAPLWTVPLAHFILGERLDRTGAGIMALAFAGAMVMLWKPELGIPWPSTRPEVLGVIAGFLFALGNVLVRKLHGLSDPAKSIAIWVGVSFAALAHVAWSGTAPAAAWSLAVAQAPLVLGMGVALVGMSLALQYGLSRMPANRAIVILLIELVVASVAAYLLAGERLRPQDWAGGALIVVATLLTARWGRTA